MRRGHGASRLCPPYACFVSLNESSDMTDRLLHETTDEYAERSHSEMLKARGGAIQAYSQVEHALASLCAALLDADEKATNILFFRITSSLHRNQAIQLLLERKFGTQYDAYWYGLPGTPGKPKTPGLMALIRSLDEMRNQIVHWAAAVNIGGPDDQGHLIRDDVLQPPNVYAERKELHQLKIADLIEFTAKAYFVGRSIYNFRSYPTMSRHARNPWHDIFRQPCIYPPLESHPLVRNPVAPETPPQSSGA
jgi:hypothetical protein